MKPIDYKDIEEFANERSIKILWTENKQAKYLGINTLKNAAENEIAFCRFDDEVGIQLISQTKSRLIFISTELANNSGFNRQFSKLNKTFLLCKTPRLELAYFLHRFAIEQHNSISYQTHKFGGKVHPTAKISDTAIVMHGAHIGENVIIGENSIVHSGAVVSNAVIGKNCSIGSNSVIGGSGFGFETDPDTGEVIHFPHIGSIRIGNSVRIGGCTCIDRASIGETIIEDQVKVDNLVHIAHNVRIGERSKVIALSIIGGSTNIGKDCWIAPASAIRDWIQIGDESIVGLGAVVTKSVEAGGTVVGNPAKPIQITRNKYL